MYGRRVASLPIDAQLSAIASALAQGNTIVEAPPGAGKTTRVPVAALDVVEGAIWVTEPRRLAARLAARRVAAELGEKVGETCGYQVRYETRCGPTTRIRFVTEGILLRRLHGDPQLAGIGAVIFDEVHERHVDTDLGLALARRLQSGARPRLRIGAMSATLDARPLSDLLNAEPIRSEGRSFDIDVAYMPPPKDRRLEVQVRAAVRELLGQPGDVLVFLPGAREIRRCAEALDELADARDFDVAILHGDLPAADQDRAVDPGRRRKVILSTNVAESSVTIEGVAAVIDSGLARHSWFSAWTGLRELRLGSISRASADQRAGRAGRTGPGRCIRLYSEHDYQTWQEHAAPEIQRADLGQAVLLLRSLGIDPGELPWLEAPPPAGLASANELLEAIGAVDARGEITDAGRRMSQLPLSPRLARLVVDADARGVGRDGAAAAGLLSERDPRPRAFGRQSHASVAGASDVADWVDRWRDRREIDRRAGADRDIERVAPQRVELVSGRRAVVHYDPGKPPWIESRLQDFFGMTRTPSVALGRVPLTLHLLAPNQRAVQVTSDLAGFWTNHYPAIKKQLERRYPKHAWPDDPTVAQPGMRKRRKR